MNIQENQIIGELVANDIEQHLYLKNTESTFAVKETEPSMMLVKLKKLMRI